MREDVCFVQGGPTCEALGSMEVFVLRFNLGICGGTFESRMSCPFMQLMVIQIENRCVKVVAHRQQWVGHKRLS